MKGEGEEGSGDEINAAKNEGEEDGELSGLRVQGLEVAVSSLSPQKRSRNDEEAAQSSPSPMHCKTLPSFESLVDSKSPRRHSRPAKLCTLFKEEGKGGDAASNRHSGIGALEALRLLVGTPSKSPGKKNNPSGGGGGSLGCEPPPNLAESAAGFETAR